MLVCRAQEHGPLPPQETALIHNTWHGKHHQEMRYLLLLSLAAVLPRLSAVRSNLPTAEGRQSAAECGSDEGACSLPTEGTGTRPTGRCGGAAKPWSSLIR